MSLKSYDSITHRTTISKFISPNQVFTLEEINRFFNGKDGNPMYVVVNGLVFDVTDRLNDFYDVFKFDDGENKEIEEHQVGKVNLLLNEVDLVGYIKYQ